MRLDSMALTLILSGILSVLRELSATCGASTLVYPGRPNNRRRDTQNPAHQALGGSRLDDVPDQKVCVSGALLDRPTPSVSLFVAGEGTVMSDRSGSVAVTGGARLAF
jgi:hypothetical protein